MKLVLKIILFVSKVLEKRNFQYWKGGFSVMIILETFTHVMSYLFCCCFQLYQDCRERHDKSRDGSEGCDVPS